MMIEITPDIKISENELQLDFIRSSGPGGQNVNKVASAVQLKFDVMNSPSLPPVVKKRLKKIAGNRITTEGVLIIEAKRFRTQEQNRADAIQRLIKLVQRALKKPKARLKTKPSRAAKEARLAKKKIRSAKKKNRKITPYDWE